MILSTLVYLYELNKAGAIEKVDGACVFILPSLCDLDKAGEHKHCTAHSTAGFRDW